MKLLLAGLLASLGVSVFAQDCGPDTPCEIAGGDYHLRLPDGPGPYPVLIWYHGHRGNGASIHRSGGLKQDFWTRGMRCLRQMGFAVGRVPDLTRPGTVRRAMTWRLRLLFWAQQRRGPIWI